MTVHQITHLIRLHARAQQHANEYKKLSGDPSTQSKALRNLEKAEWLYSQVRTLISDLISDTP